MSYEHDLDLKIAELIDPLDLSQNMSIQEAQAVVAKIKAHFIETRRELFDILIYGKLQDILDTSGITLDSFGKSALRVVDSGEQVIVNFTPDEADPDPETTLAYIKRECVKDIPNVQVNLIQTTLME